MEAYRPWHKEVEENVRMLAGRQWDAYMESIGEFQDLSRLIPDERWRNYPVFHWLAHWYKLTLSKLTENLPTVGFLPATADYTDARLAQVLEPVWKYQWHQMEMPERMFALYGWVIAACRGITKLRWDPDKGPAEEFRGPAHLEFAQGNAVSRRTLTDAPYVRNQETGLYEPAVVRGPDGQPMLDEQGNPRMRAPETGRLGDLAFDVLVPVSVVTPHGPEPFHEKPWYTQEYLLPVDEIERRYSVEVEPDDVEPDQDLYLRLAFGTNYGMPSSWTSAYGPQRPATGVLRGYKRVREHWRRDIPNHPILHRGRLTIVVKEGVLYDDINPFWVQGEHEQVVMPFDAFDGIVLPFRQEGASDLEVLKPIQRSLNRRMAAMQDAVEYNEQSPTVWNDAVFDDADLAQVNRPGTHMRKPLNAASGMPAFRLEAADVPAGSANLADRLQAWMQMLGSQPLSSEGLPATRDPSGELQREVRFDVDRVWGATIRAHSYVWTRIALKMQHILATCMEDHRLLVLSGEDNACVFLEVGRDLFRGRVHAFPQPESQVLESRQEKQNRVLALVGAGIVPPELAAEVLQYPDVQRALRPGGPAWAMAERENLELALGQQPPVLPEHDHAVHLLVHRRFQQTSYYRDAEPAAQEAVRVHVMFHEQQQAAEAIRQGSLANLVLAATAPPAPAPTPGGQGGSKPSQQGGTPRALKGGEPQTPGAADPRRAAVRLIG